MGEKDSVAIRAHRGVNAGSQTQHVFLEYVGRKKNIEDYGIC